MNIEKMLVCSMGLLVAAGAGAAERNFGEDVAFLKKHADVRVLRGEGGARVAVVPAWQGRVMTSTAGGETGSSCGWINDDQIRAGIKPEADRTGLDRHIHIFGGEERLWLGPEGGQYALFFPAGTKDFVFDTWKTPAVMDTEAFEVVSEAADRMVFRAEAALTNVAGTKLQLRLDREVAVRTRADLETLLGAKIPSSLAVAGYTTDNRVTNTGTEAWTKEGGLVSIWVLGMFKHGARTVMVMPVKPGEGPAANSDYFGVPGPERFQMTPTHVFFLGDGGFRSKLGIPPARARELCGSYDPDRKRLTLLVYNLPKDAAKLPYVRSQWMQHEHPYAGDVINVYNDGPTEGGEQMGPFYELESSSPALPLAPGESIRHVQSTIHIEGDVKALDSVARAALGISLKDIEQVFPGKP